MLAALWIFTIGLMPLLLSMWMMRRYEAQTQTKLRQAMNATTRARRQLYTTPRPSERYYLEGVGYLIGDISCRFNARSGYLRCAVNPHGPCQGCRYYDPTEVSDSKENT